MGLEFPGVSQIVLILLIFLVLSISQKQALDEIYV
jgi:hypothetical protein